MNVARAVADGPGLGTEFGHARISPSVGGAKSENTHWLDASNYSDMAANMKGIRLAGPVVSKPTQTIPSVVAGLPGSGKPRMSLGQLVTAARGQ